MDRHSLFFLALLVAGLLCHGGVHDWYVFASFTAVFAVCLTLKEAPRIVFVFTTGLFAFAFIQLVPMPAFVQAALSPTLYSARECIGSGQGFYPLAVEPVRTFIGWLKIFTVLGVIFVSFHYFKGRSRREFFRLFFILTFIESFYALIAYFFGFDSFLLFGGRVFNEFATGSFVNKNHFGMFVAAGIPCGIYLCISSYRSIRKGLREDRAAHNMIIYGLMTFTLLAALLLSRSRGAVVSLAVGLALFAFLLGRKDKTRVLLAYAGIGAVAVSVLFWIKDPGVAGRFYEGGYRSTGGRFELWGSSLRLLSDYPAVGIGPGSFRVAFERHNDLGGFLQQYQHPHNEYLAFLIDFGLPVGVAVIVLLSLLLYRSVGDSYIREGAFAKVPLTIFVVFLVNFLVDFNLRIPVNGILFGIVCGYLVSKINLKVVAGRIIPLSSLWMLAAAVACFTFYDSDEGYMKVDPGLSPMNYKVLIWRGLMSRGAGDYGEAKRYLDCAASAAPFNPDVYFHRAITYHDAIDISDSAREIIDSAQGIAMPCDRMVSLFRSLTRLSDKELFAVYRRLRPGCTREVVRFCLEGGRDAMLIELIEKEKDLIFDSSPVIELLEKHNSYLALMILMDYAVAAVDDDRFVALLARSQLNLGKWRSAETLLKERLKRRRSLPLYLGLAELYKTLGSRKELIMILQEAQTHFPDSPEAARMLGDAYMESGLYSESLEAYATYLRLTSDRSVAPQIKQLLQQEEVRRKTTIPNIIYKVFADDREVMEQLNDGR